MRVFILQTYRDGEDKFGVECVYNTLKIGFPTAKVETHVNAGITHDSWIEGVFQTRCDSDAPMVFLDTDVIFYDNVEEKLAKIAETLAGRYTPMYFNEVVNSNEIDRYHTSLLYISNPRKLKAYIDSVVQTKNFPFDPFRAFIFKLHGKSLFYDTCANLYHSIPKEDRFNFPPDILNCYAHLVSGTMLNYVSSRIKYGEKLKEIHIRAKTNPESVRGNWKEHDQFYKQHPLL